MSDPAAIRDLNTPLRLLMGPGPSDVHHRVLRAMATPLVGHLDPRVPQDHGRDSRHAAGRPAHEEPADLRRQRHRQRRHGSLLANLIEPGDAVAIGVNGVFGTRMTDVAARLGATVHRIDAPWGRIIEPEAVAQT
jgi:alanine-glyoxylate transaminase / serine-glyoxylate transaminase / serine-pyruvate transaminase